VEKASRKPSATGADRAEGRPEESALDGRAETGAEFVVCKLQDAPAKSAK